MSVQLTKLFIEFVSELISENSSMMPDEVKKMLSSKENKARIENEFIKKNNIKQKKEKKTDTGEPKRPRTAYILFCQDEREHVTQANPGLANKDITSLLGKKWKEVKESFPRTFEQFNTVALREKSEYEEKMREYRTANNIPEKVKRVPKPKTSTVEKAKTPFFYYLKDKTIEFLIDRPSMKKRKSMMRQRPCGRNLNLKRMISLRSTNRLLRTREMNFLTLKHLLHHLQLLNHYYHHLELQTNQIPNLFLILPSFHLMKLLNFHLHQLEVQKRRKRKERKREVMTSLKMEKRRRKRKREVMMMLKTEKRRKKEN